MKWSKSIIVFGTCGDRLGDESSLVIVKAAHCGEYTEAKQNKLKKQNHVNISESAKIVKESKT